MKYPSQIIDWLGKKITLTWIKLDRDSDLNKFKPITQAYGVCFNDEGEILILDQKGDEEWTLPGGTVEPGETPKETLTREVMEEADVTLTDILVLGVQRVDDPSNTGPKGKSHYQARFVARIDQILPQTVDPAEGRVHQRKFVPNTQINQYIKWGSTGKAIFADALKVWRSHDKS